VTVAAEFDVAAALELRRRVLGVAAECSSPIVVDLSAVISLCGQAVGIIAAVRAELRSRFSSLGLVTRPSLIASRVLPDSGMSLAGR